MLFRLLIASALFCRAFAAYDDSFARKEILYLSAAAYSTTPAQCLKGVIPRWPCCAKRDFTSNTLLDCFYRVELQ